MNNSTLNHFVLVLTATLGFGCGEEAADSPADGNAGVGAGGTGAGSDSSTSPGATNAASTGSSSGTSSGGAGPGGTTSSTDGAGSGTSTTATATSTTDSTPGATTSTSSGSNSGAATTDVTTDPTDTATSSAGGAGGTTDPGDDGSMAAGGAGGSEPMVDEGMGGMVGVGGMGGDEPGGGGSDTACGAAGLSFCTDFEVDALPAELEYFPEYQRENIANFVTIDSTASHSGTRSARFAGIEFSQMLGVATPGPTFWGRVYLMSDTDIQNGHNTYVAATDGTGDPNDGEHIRIGEHQCQLEVNRKSDDAEQLSNGGEYVCSGGFEMTANTWYCLEFFYDGPGSELQVFVDGTEIPELHNTTWGPYDYSLFKFGFEKYHGDNKNLWYDDVALGSERIGCFD